MWNTKVIFIYGREGYKINISTLMQLVSLDYMAKVIKIPPVENKSENIEFAVLLAQAFKAAANIDNNNQSIMQKPYSIQVEKTFTYAAKKDPLLLNNITEKIPPSKRYDHLIAASACKYGIESALLKGLIKTESNFNETARSQSGALGLTQLMPNTARYLGVNPLNPAEAIEGGAKYLSQMLHHYKNNIEMALAAYNAGPGSVDKYGGIPPYKETQLYIQKVKQNAIIYKNDF